MFNPEKQIFEGGFEKETMKNAKEAILKVGDRLFSKEETTEEEINKQKQNF